MLYFTDWSYYPSSKSFQNIIFSRKDDYWLLIIGEVLFFSSINQHPAYISMSTLYFYIGSTLVFNYNGQTVCQSHWSLSNLYNRMSACLQSWKRKLTITSEGSGTQYERPVSYSNRREWQKQAEFNTNIARSISYESFMCSCHEVLTTLKTIEASYMLLKDVLNIVSWKTLHCMLRDPYNVILHSYGCDRIDCDRILLYPPCLAVHWVRNLPYLLLKLFSVPKNMCSAPWRFSEEGNTNEMSTVTLTPAFRIL